MMENNRKTDYEMELRCEEVREVMSRIPPAIVRWGMTVMTVIMGALLIAACMIDWPKTEECPCIVNTDGNQYIISISLSQEILAKLIKEKKLDVNFEVSIFNTGRPIRGIVRMSDLQNDGNGRFTAIVPAGWSTDNFKLPPEMIPFKGKASFLVSDRKLISYLFPFLDFK